MPCVASGWSNGRRQEVCGKQKLEEVWESASCYRNPSSPLQSVLTRRPTAATCWRMLRLTRLQSIGGSLRLPLLQNGACDFRLTPLLSILMLVTQTWREIVSLLPRFRIVAMSMQRL